MMPNSVSDDGSSGSGSNNSNNNGGGGGGNCGSGSGSGGGGGGGGSITLKKGPWTAAEDGILIEYVKKHGEGNWNAVQKNSGLSRCGKSCRLRWANHLRPNLKKGSFSPEEERLILELHAKLGNKWARMAAQLPGRTDNEIKNYWNTRVKRRQRAGLPLYPQDIQKQTSSFQLHPNNHHHQTRPSSMAMSSQQQKPNFMTPLSLFDPMNYPTAQPLLSQRNNSPYLPSPLQGLKRFRGSNVGFSHQFSPPPRTPTVSSSSSLFNYNFSSQLSSTPNLQYDMNTYNYNPPSMLHNYFEPSNLITPGSTFSVKTELPSSQISQPAANTLASGITNDQKISPSFARNNSGLLDALLQEAEAMGGREQAKQEGLTQTKDEKSGALEDFLANGPPSGSVFSENAATPPLGSGSQWDEASSAQSSAGVEIKKESTVEINNSVEDDDLSSLLNILPSSMMVSDLYNEGAETSNGQSSVTDDGIGLDRQHVPTTTTSGTTTAMDQDWTIGAWNNLPEMC